MTRKSRKSQKKGAPSSAELSSPEKLQALSELGLSAKDLQRKKPVWPYVVGGAMIIGALSITILE